MPDLQRAISSDSPAQNAAANSDTASTLVSGTGTGTVSSDEYEVLAFLHRPSASGVSGTPLPSVPQPWSSLTGRSPKPSDLQCSECDYVGKTRSDLRKHAARHRPAHYCEFPDCGRRTQGFATINDLERHMKAVHKIHNRSSKYWKCFGNDCSKPDREWPRRDNFKQHLDKMHPYEDAAKLLRMSEDWYNSTQQGLEDHGSDKRNPLGENSEIHDPPTSRSATSGNSESPWTPASTDFSRPVSVIELMGNARCVPCQQSSRRCHVEQGFESCLQCGGNNACMFNRLVPKIGRLAEFSWSELIGEVSTRGSGPSPRVAFREELASTSSVSHTGTAQQRSRFPLNNFATRPAQPTSGESTHIYPGQPSYTPPMT